MKRLFYLIMGLILSISIIPAITVDGWNEFARSQTEAPSSEKKSDEQIMISVKFKDIETPKEMNLHDYLIGVVGAEMPATFHEEALKAQAVAARSYTLYKKAIAQSNPNAFPTHNGADVCTDINHCKAFSSLEELHNGWGADFDEYYAKIENAVSSTDAEAALYNNQPINAVFHSTSSGVTEDSKAVWGGDVPYLKSVASPGDELSPRYKSQEGITPEAFKAKMLENYPDMKLGDDPSGWITASDISPTNLVKSITIGGIPAKGSTLRKIFNLRSATFKLSYNGEIFVFDVTGYGHGVGMSQYGAEAMAQNGKTYKEIIEHYYTGAIVNKIPK